MQLRLLPVADTARCEGCGTLAMVALDARGKEWQLCTGCLGQKLVQWRWERHHGA
jgi:formylmethanofuran dehydrogenase subunit E